ncbi:uncharacterized protein LOC143276176 [Babylonia areolata]|uniref:uncharacterized protein LOC143276176 n=1 Tax=Babylonia areolata TaxID=304850 RepID=UPI003FD2F96A
MLWKLREHTVFGEKILSRNRKEKETRERKLWLILDRSGWVGLVRTALHDVWSDNMVTPIVDRWTNYTWLTLVLCLATFSVKTSTGAYRAQIEVTPNPSLHGQTITLRCLLVAPPVGQMQDSEEQSPVAYVWYNEGREMPGVKAASVTLKADAGHAASYQCQSRLSGIHSMPFSPRVSHILVVSESASPVEDGQPMTLTCMTSAEMESRPYRMMNWAKNNHEVKESQNQTFTAVADVSRPSFYECRVLSGQIYISPPFTPQVYPRTPSIQRTGPHHLTCHTHSPLCSPQALWLKDGQKLDTETSPTLDLSHHAIRPGHTRFACKVTAISGIFSKLSEEFVVTDADLVPAKKNEPEEQPASESHQKYKPNKKRMRRGKKDKKGRKGRKRKP